MAATLKKLVRHVKKMLFQPTYRREFFALRRLKKMSRFMPTSTHVLDFEIQLIDAESFVGQYQEIFQKQIYKFSTQTQQPYVIDCGANIGLSLIYLKRLYPTSRIIAFEPDIRIFTILEENIKHAHIHDVELCNYAVWNSVTMLEFTVDGAAGGRVVQLESNSYEKDRYQVKTVRLRDYLQQPIDFLKLDIEGAETSVLQDCQDLMKNIQNLFVEYHSFVSQPQTLHIIVNILQQAGFRLHIEAARKLPSPLYNRKILSGMDTQMNIFAFRD